MSNKLKYDKRKLLLLPTIILSLAVTIIYNPFWNMSNINNFNRILGNGILNGVNISKRINSIIIFDVVVIPLVLYCIWKILNKLFENVTNYKQEAIRALNIVSAIGIVPIIFAHINRFSNPEIIGIEIILPCFLIIYLLLYIWINSKNSMSFNKFKWCIISVTPVSIFSMLLFYKLGFIVKGVRISLFLNSFIFMIVHSFIVGIYYFLIVKFEMKINFNALKKSYLIIMISPILVSILLEFINILNQFNIFINYKFKLCSITYIITFGVFIIKYKMSKNDNDNNKQFCFEKYYYPIILICMAVIFTQPNLQNLFNTDFFEQSNHGTAIQQLFEFGKIPIIETFDAHMLQNQIGSIIYGILNKDYSGAVFYGYSLLPIFVIMFYILLVKFFDRDISFLLMILFPILSDTTFALFSLVPLVIISFLYANKYRNYKSYVVYWLSIAFTCLFRLDMGFTLAFSTLVAWIIIYYLNSKQINLKKLILSCISVLLFFTIVYLSICIVKKVPPIYRIIEFLKLCQSNTNWGYSSLGNISSVAFSVCYFIIPTIVTLLLIKLIFNERTNINISSKKIIILIIGLVSLFNLPRGMVRHSLVENTNLYIMSSTGLFFSLYIYVYSKNNKLLKFSLSSVAICIFSSLLMTQSIFIPRILSNKAIARYMTFDSFQNLPLEKVERVVLSDDMKKVYEPLKEILNSTLSKNETYIDFTNQTLLYALTNREKPVYINQSPGLLCGEYTQKDFIDECDKNKEKIPFVLMPLEPMTLSFDLDGIQNSYRYYLVSEYISNNFKPLFRTQQFAIWCRNDRFEEKLRLMNDMLLNSEEEYLNIDNSNFDRLSGINLSISSNESNMILKSTDPDPILVGLENLNEIQDIKEKSNFIDISIDYESNVEGIFELFYTTENGEEFNQNKVVSKTLGKSGTFQTVIPCTQYTKLRFDIPEKSIVNIKNIKVKQESNVYNNYIYKIDYNYLLLDRHTYNLGNIPYIWANFDKINLKDKKHQLELYGNNEVYNFNSLDKSTGNYMYINSSSDNEGIMTVQLGKEEGSQFIPLNQYSFQLKIGNKNDYIIRISSDFMWYSGEINSIKIISDNNSKINNVSILKGDILK